MLHHCHLLPDYGTLFAGLGNIAGAAIQERAAVYAYEVTIDTQRTEN